MKFKNLISLFTRNWWLKLLALALALAVFYGVRGTIHGTHTPVDPTLFMRGTPNADANR